MRKGRFCKKKKKAEVNICFVSQQRPHPCGSSKVQNDIYIFLLSYS